MPIPAFLAIAVVLAFAACGGATSTTTPTSEAGGGASPAAAACSKAAAAGEVSVEIADFQFNPDPIQAKVGDTITWTNRDSAPHSAALDDGSCATDTLNDGDAGSLTFTAPGTYAYHCAIHPSQMKGTVEVSG